MSHHKSYTPNQTEPFKLSRSKLDLFLNCPRCFYLDRRFGIGRVSGPAFTLNSAVDHLLKKEFDIHRVAETRHPLLEQYGIDAWPVAHPDLELWRANFTGIQYLHPATNLLITGAIDDLWINPAGEYIVVDYKATSKQGRILSLDDSSWRLGYERQMSIYQWLLRQNGHKVSKTGYFVYCNGQKDREAFDGKLEFDVTVFPYEGDDSWVEQCVLDAHQCLNSDTIPAAAPECPHCEYVRKINAADV
jgi:hypothetical protein